MRHFKTDIKPTSSDSKIRFFSSKENLKSNFSKQLTDFKISTNKILIHTIKNSIKSEKLIKKKSIDSNNKMTHWEDKTIFLTSKTNEFKVNIKKFLLTRKKLSKCSVKKLFPLNQLKTLILNIIQLQWKKLKKMLKQSFTIYIQPFLKRILNFKSWTLN